MVKQYGLVFDLRRCIGCRTCIIACKVENSLEDYSWMKVQTSNGLTVDIPEGKYPELSLSWQPITCMHCQETVRKAVDTVDGVSNVNVDLNTGQVAFAYGSDDTKPIKEIIRDKGYEVVD